MKRQDLITFSREGSRHRLRTVLATLVFFLAWMTALAWKADTILDGLGVWQFLLLAAVPMVVFVAVAVKLFYTMPKCPHCGIRFVGPLLITAVATGNCGHCGRNVED
jgi:hypothetical protein